MPSIRAIHIQRRERPGEGSIEWQRTRTKFARAGIRTTAFARSSSLDLGVETKFTGTFAKQQSRVDALASRRGFAHPGHVGPFSSPEITELFAIVQEFGFIRPAVMRS